MGRKRYPEDHCKCILCTRNGPTCDAWIRGDAIMFANGSFSWIHMGDASIDPSVPQWASPGPVPPIGHSEPRKFWIVLVLLSILMGIAAIIIYRRTRRTRDSASPSLA